MAIIPQTSMFDYEADLKDYGDLERLRMVLEDLPDEGIVRMLEERRGPRGRDDYPVRMMWNLFIALIVFQHTNVASLLRELKRNVQLRWAVSGGSMSSQGVPSADAMSRFFKNLGTLQAEIDGMVDIMVEEIRGLLPELGKYLAMDSKMIASWSPGESAGKERDGRGEHDARWGKKKYTGKRRDGSIWEKEVSCFGFKLHLLVDSLYELPLAYEVTPANTSDTPEGMKLVQAYRSRHPELYDGAKYLSADRGYDSQDLVEELAEDGIVAVIDTREMWKEREHPLMDHENLTYTEKGIVYCACPVTGKRREMGNQGYEGARDCVRKVCPMRQYSGLVCQGAAFCRVSGKSIRIPRETDPRAFQRMPRDSHKWKREYKRRTGVERVNSRLDVSFGFEEHTIRGQKKMRLRLSLALLVMLAMAAAHLKAKGSGCQTYRSLVRMPA